MLIAPLLFFFHVVAQRSRKTAFRRVSEMQAPGLRLRPSLNAVTYVTLRCAATRHAFVPFGFVTTDRRGGEARIPKLPADRHLLTAAAPSRTTPVTLVTVHAAAANHWASSKPPTPQSSLSAAHSAATTPCGFSQHPALVSQEFRCHMVPGTLSTIVDAPADDSGNLHLPR